MNIIHTVWLLGVIGLGASVYGVAVTGGAVLSILFVLVLLAVLGLALYTMRKDTELLEQMERVAMDANRGILESRITMIPIGHRYEQCAWAINEMMDQTETVFRDTSTVLQRMVVGEYGRMPQPVGLRGVFPQLLETVADVQHRVQLTMDSLAHVMKGIGEGDLSVRMSDDVEKLFREQVNGAMVSLEGILKQFDEIMQRLANGDCTESVDLEGVKGDFLSLGNNINHSISQLKDAIIETVSITEMIGQGDLSRNIEGDYKGALGRMRDSVNSAQARLSETVSQVRNVANQVKDGANEVSKGSLDLSDRTSQQAANLAETSASMSEIASMVNMSSENASLASELAEASVERVTEGTTVITNAVEAMEGINDSSNKISEIITLIDGIAFQTNLLALNAAVEAARAGEHGRGFAVVAGEVRSLAQRSAEAAKDIKSLIEDSTARIESGSKLVSESGGALGAVQDAINKMNGIAGEIASVAKEQTAGIAQINTSITTLDSTTQSNAALVEETAAASANLSELSDQLESMVSFFKLQDRYKGASRATATGGETADSAESGSTSLADLDKKFMKPPSAPSRPVERSSKMAVPEKRVQTSAAVSGDSEWSEF